MSENRHNLKTAKFEIIEYKIKATLDTAAHLAVRVTKSDGTIVEYNSGAIDQNGEYKEFSVNND